MENRNSPSLRGESRKAAIRVAENQHCIRFNLSERLIRLRITNPIVSAALLPAA